MRLIVNRSQQPRTDRRGRPSGKVDFTLELRLELTPEELETVTIYGLGSHALTYTTFQGTQIPDDTIDKLVQGRTQTLGSIDVVLNNEEMVRQAVAHLPALLAAVRGYGGGEVIEYPLGGTDTEPLPEPEPVGTNGRVDDASSGAGVDYRRR